MTGVMRTALILLASILTFTGIASAQQLSRADAVAQALAANPTVKLSLEQVALLEGRIVEARADALPDITWNTLALRSRDPGAAEQSRTSMSFRRSSATRWRPIPGQCLLDGGRRPADALQLQAGEGARGGARRARRGRAGHAAGAAGDGARCDSRVQPAAVRDRAAARHSHERAVEADARRLRAQPARRRRGDRARSAARRSRSRERARRSAARRERSVRRARAAEHGDAAADDRRRSCRPTTLAVVPFAADSMPRSRSAHGEARAAAAAHAGAGAGRCSSMSPPRMRSRASSSTAPTGLPCAGPESLRSGLLALVRGHQSARCRSSTAGARPAAWRRRARSATP